MAAADSNTVVVGIDGTECGNDALRWAIAEAATSRRRLMLVHAWRWTSDAVGGAMGAPDGRREGWAMLARATQAAREHGVAAQADLAEGPPAEVLLKVGQGAAMLVVGAHGYHRLARTFLGSVSRACVENAPCPVVVVPAATNTAGEGKPVAAVRGRQSNGWPSR